MMRERRRHPLDERRAAICDRLHLSTKAFVGRRFDERWI